MTIFVTVLLLLAFSLGVVLGLLNVLQDLLKRDAHKAPVFQDPGPLFHDQGSAQREVRSQFAWQSRSHFRAPD